jgi:hypothetical protein
MSSPPQVSSALAPVPVEPFDDGSEQDASDDNDDRNCSFGHHLFLVIWSLA